MGWSTSVVAPPDGDMAAYMRSLEKLRTVEDRKGRVTKHYQLKPRPFAKATLANAWRTLRPSWAG